MLVTDGLRFLSAINQLGPVMVNDRLRIREMVETWRVARIPPPCVKAAEPNRGGEFLINYLIRAADRGVTALE
jgi:hypothetical protein